MQPGRMRDFAPEPSPPPASPARPVHAAAAVPPPRHATAPAAARGAPERRTALKTPRLSPWIAAVLAVVAIIEALVIVSLVLRPPATAVSAAAPPRTPIPVAEQVITPPPALPPAAPVVSEQPTPSRPDPIAAAASTQRSGGIRLQTPIELKVLQGDRVLGSSADGPIILPAGTHQLDLINTALGLRMRRAVTFRAGQIANLDVTPPPGRVSVNAQPWAEVSIDSRVIGETPLANVSVPIGEHEVVFRHPELGERRQTITVRADAPTRVSATFER